MGNSNVKFGPDNHKGYEKDLFLAEYNSLRAEILQRIGQQTTLYEIDIAAFGVILSYALQKMDDHSIYNDVMIICAYPFLAFLLTSGWAFNQRRICQIAQYLRQREKEISASNGLVWWENYVSAEPEISAQHKVTGKENKIILKLLEMLSLNQNKPGIMILTGSQIASIAISILLLIQHVYISGIKTTFCRIQVFAILVVIVLNIVLTYGSRIMIKRSGWA